MCVALKSPAFRIQISFWSIRYLAIQRLGTFSILSNSQEPPEIHTGVKTHRGKFIQSATGSGNTLWGQKHTSENPDPAAFLSDDNHGGLFKYYLGIIHWDIYVQDLRT